MKTNLEPLTTERLVLEFVRVAQRRGAAVLDSETRRANQSFFEMEAIDRELRSRGHEARMALAPMLGDNNRFVRYYAAKYLLGLLQDRARRVIEEIAEFKYDALCIDAGMCLYTLDHGIFQPD